MKVMKARSIIRRAPERTVPMQDASGGLRAHARLRAHEALDEVPGVLRRLKTFLLVASITMAAFAVGMLVVMWHAVG